MPTEKEIPVKPSEQDMKNYTIDAITHTGTPFHLKCISEITKASRWSVVEKEFPINIDSDSTKIDIVATASSSSTHAIVECKKANNLFKTWVFFTDKKQGSGDRSNLSVFGNEVAAMRGIPVPAIIFDYIFPKITNPSVGIVEDYILGRVPKPYILEYAQAVVPYVCYDGYSVKLDYEATGVLNVNSTHNATDKNTVENACSQVLLGCRGRALWLQKKMKHSLKPNQKVDASDFNLFIPIVVTTAKLMVCEINSDNIKIQTGEVIDKTSVIQKPVNWLVYNYRPSKEQLQSAELPIYRQEFEIKDSFSYVSSIFFVNSEHLKEFLDTITC